MGQSSWPYAEDDQGNGSKLCPTPSPPTGTQSSNRPPSWGVVHGTGEQRQTVDVMLPAQSIEQQFALLAGHELRTPLTVLYGALQLLARKPEVQDADCQELLGLALQEARNLQSCIDGLIDLSRLRTGRLWLDLHIHDLNQIAVTAVRRGRLLAHGLDIRLDTHSTAVPARVDMMRVEQILLNLLSNAVEHAPTRRGIDVRVVADEQQGYIHVRDYGRGLWSTDPDVLFAPFALHHEDVMPRRGGLGVGLYVARQLAQLHGGNLDVSSADGPGTTFMLKLPLVRSSLVE